MDAATGNERLPTVARRYAEETKGRCSLAHDSFGGPN